MKAAPRGAAFLFLLFALTVSADQEAVRVLERSRPGAGGTASEALAPRCRLEAGGPAASKAALRCVSSRSGASTSTPSRVGTIADPLKLAPAVVLSVPLR